MVGVPSLLASVMTSPLTLLSPRLFVVPIFTMGPLTLASIVLDIFVSLVWVLAPPLAPGVLLLTLRGSLGRWVILVVVFVVVLLFSCLWVRVSSFLLL